MKFFRFPGFALLLASTLLVGCGHQSAPPAVVTTAAQTTDGQLPFAREGNAGGISPTSTVIPPSAHVPFGTAVTIHLQSEISSATAHPGDTFEAVLDEPVMLNGKVLADRGTPVTGRIIEAKRAG